SAGTMGKCTAGGRRARRRCTRTCTPLGRRGRLRCVRQQAISALMTTDIVSIDVGQPLSDAYHALKGAPYHHIPVLDGDRPVGMISSTDVLKLVYDVEGASDKVLTAMLDHQFTIEDAM